LTVSSENDDYIQNRFHSNAVTRIKIFKLKIVTCKKSQNTEAEGVNKFPVLCHT